MALHGFAGVLLPGTAKWYDMLEELGGLSRDAATALLSAPVRQDEAERDFLTRMAVKNG